MKLGVVILYVDDLAKQRAFYTELLGLNVIYEVPEMGYLSLHAGSDALIGLQDKSALGTSTPNAQQPANVEVSFIVDNVEETWQRWKEYGCELVTEPMDMPFGRYCVAKDPEGFIISAYTPTAQVAAIAEASQAS